MIVSAVMLLLVFIGFGKSFDYNLQVATSLIY